MSVCNKKTLLPILNQVTAAIVRGGMREGLKIKKVVPKYGNTR